MRSLIPSFSSIFLPGTIEARTINIFSSFGYFENDNEHQKVLNAASNALKLGGLFFLDVVNRDSLINNFQKRNWKKLADGSLILTERSYDLSTGKVHQKRTRIWSDKEREECYSMIRIFSATELIQMLQKAGLSEIKTFGSFEGAELSFTSPRIIIVSQKSHAV